MPMDHDAIFLDLENRDPSLFPNGLSENQKSGISIKLDVWEKWYAATYPITYLAAALGQIYHETGYKMMPVLEAFAQNRAESANMLQKAYDEGRLKWVKTPYWNADETGQHPVGGGDIQLTHRRNYITAQEKLKSRFDINIPLSDDYDLALEPVISAHIAFAGMIEGWFRPCKLSDFESENGFDYCGARNIVNGDTHIMGEKIKSYCQRFESALKAGLEADSQSVTRSPNNHIDWPRSCT